MKPTPGFARKFADFVAKRGYDVETIMEKCKVSKVIATNYQNEEYMAKRQWVENKPFMRVKAWMDGVLLQEQAEQTAKSNLDLFEITIFVHLKGGEKLMTRMTKAVFLSLVEKAKPDDFIHFPACGWSDPTARHYIRKSELAAFTI